MRLMLIFYYLIFESGSHVDVYIDYLLINDEENHRDISTPSPSFMLGNGFP